MINVASNRVAVLEDEASITNRVRLLLLTSPEEMYNEPELGVGLKKYLWQYNNENTRAILRDNIKTQLRDHEPSVKADETQFADGLTTSTDTETMAEEMTHMKMTVMMKSIYQGQVEVEVE